MEKHRPVAYTFVRYSYQFNSNIPHCSSKARLFVIYENCEKAMRNMVDKDFGAITDIARLEDWDYKYTYADECSGSVRADYEIRGYDTEYHDNDFVVLYQYKMYPIFNSKTSNAVVYRGFGIIPITCVDEGDKLKIKMKVISDKDNIDLDLHETIGEAIDAINNLLTYMDAIGNRLFKEEEEL